MKSIALILPLTILSASASKFKVFHNTLDPAIFGTKGGATLKATEAAAGDEHVDALTLCVRFQVRQFVGRTFE